MTRAIFWDNDGVLVDTEHLYCQATQQVLASVGVDLSTEQYLDLFLVKGTGAWHLAEARGVDGATIARLKAERNTLYGQWLRERSRLLPGVAPVLEALHGQYVMGVVTSSRRDHFDAIHARTGVLQYFDFVITADDVRRVKPDPEPYARAIERSGVEPDACMAVEDSERGLEAATRAGIPCVVVPTPLTRGCRFTRARRVLQSVDQVVEAAAERAGTRSRVVR
jgi:HAD superfamily hydrolase (TIGR01509 family)